MPHQNTKDISLSITTFIIISIIKSLAVVSVLLTAVAYSVWLERKVSARIQNRWGPTRVGPFGLLQPLADGAKFIFKEDLTQPHVYKPLYIAAPIIALVFAITSISVIPFGNWVTVGPWGTYLQITDVNIGLLVVLGILRWACTVSRLPDGPRTTSIRCSADCAPARRWSAMKFRSVSRWWEC